MLVLTRKKNEKIVIGEGENQVTITVVDIRGDKIRIGVEAEKRVPVHRQEVWDSIHKND
jgi:carbon storage regulator